MASGIRSNNSAIVQRIQKSLVKGYSLDIITEILGVSIEEVEKAKNKM